MIISSTVGIVISAIVTVGYAWLVFLWVGRQAYALNECKKFSKAIKEVVLPMIERMYVSKARNEMIVSDDDLVTISTLSRTINWGRVNMKSDYIGQWPWRDTRMLMEGLLNTNAIAYLILERKESPFAKGVKQDLDLTAFTRDFTILINRFMEARDSFTTVSNTVEGSARVFLWTKVAVSALGLIPLWCLWFN